MDLNEFQTILENQLATENPEMHKTIEPHSIEQIISRLKIV